MHDEPGWLWEMPPVATSTVVRDRWVGYLQAQNLTASDVGGTGWSSHGRWSHLCIVLRVYFLSDSLQKVHRAYENDFAALG
jgi:hypothetical protein